MPDSSPFLLSLASVVIAIIAVFGVLGLVVAFMGNKGKGMSEVQANTIVALQAQNDAQEKQIKILERKITRLESTFSTLQVTLEKRRGLVIEIDDDLITLVDKSTGAEHTVRISTTGQHEIALQKEEAV